MGGPQQKRAQGILSPELSPSRGAPPGRRSAAPPRGSGRLRPARRQETLGMVPKTPLFCSRTNWNRIDKKKHINRKNANNSEEMGQMLIWSSTTIWGNPLLKHLLVWRELKRRQYISWFVVGVVVRQPSLCGNPSWLAFKRCQNENHQIDGPQV